MNHEESACSIFVEWRRIVLSPTRVNTRALAWGPGVSSWGIRSHALMGDSPRTDSTEKRRPQAATLHRSWAQTRFCL
jgi:hypothetical protein